MTLSLTLTDDDGGHLCLDATAKVQGFSGSCQVWLRRDELTVYCEQLATLDTSLHGSARLDASGTGEQLRVDIQPFGGSGRLLVSIIMKVKDARELTHELTTAFIVPEPSGLTRFRNLLIHLRDGQVGAVAVISASIARADA